jgi:hypothetical protein
MPSLPRPTSPVRNLKFTPIDGAHLDSLQLHHAPVESRVLRYPTPLQKAYGVTFLRAATVAAAVAVAVADTCTAGLAVDNPAAEGNKGRVGTGLKADSISDRAANMAVWATRQEKDSTSCRRRAVQRPQLPVRLRLRLLLLLQQLCCRQHDIQRLCW